MAKNKAIWVALIFIIGIGFLLKAKFSKPDPVEEQIRLMNPATQQSAATNIPPTQRPNTPEQNMYSGQKVEAINDPVLLINSEAKKEWEKCFPKFPLEGKAWSDLNSLQQEAAKQLGHLESEDLLQTSKIFKNPEGKIQQLKFSNDLDRNGNQLVVMQLFEKQGERWKEIELSREESRNPDANIVEKYLDRAPITENLEKSQYAYEGGVALIAEKRNEKVQKLIYSGGKGKFICQPEQGKLGNAKCGCNN